MCATLPRSVVGTRSPFYLISQRCVEPDAPRLCLRVRGPARAAGSACDSRRRGDRRIAILYFARSVVAALRSGQILSSFARVKGKLKMKKIDNAAATIVGRRYVTAGSKPTTTKPTPSQTGTRDPQILKRRAAGMTSKLKSWVKRCGLNSKRAIELPIQDISKPLDKCRARWLSQTTASKTIAIAAAHTIQPHGTGSQTSARALKLCIPSKGLVQSCSDPL